MPSQFQALDKNTQTQILQDIGLSPEVAKTVDASKIDFAKPVDPNTVVQETNRFTARAWNIIEDFEKKNGRMPELQELPGLLGTTQNNFLRVVSGLSESSSVTTNPLRRNTLRPEDVKYYDLLFKPLPANLRGLDPLKQTVMGKVEVVKAVNYFAETGERNYHPKIVQMAQSVGLSPGTFLANQAKLHGLRFNEETLRMLGQYKPNVSLSKTNSDSLERKWQYLRAVS